MVDDTDDRPSCLDWLGFLVGLALLWAIIILIGWVVLRMS